MANVWYFGYGILQPRVCICAGLIVHHTNLLK